MFVALNTGRQAVKLKLGGIALRSLMPLDKADGIIINFVVCEKEESKMPAMSRVK